MWVWMLGLWACSPDDPATDADTPTPLDPVAAAEEPGPWNVGYKVTEVTYEPPDASGPRTLRVAIWYPTEAPAPAEVEVKYMGLFEAPGVLDAPAPAAGPFPLMVLSHGHQAFAEVFGALVSHMATRGYVVVAPDHTGNTTFDSPDRLTPIYYQRMTDISAVLDHTLGGEEPGLPALDGRVLGMGHSFGGYTMAGLLGAQFDVDGLEATCAGSTDTTGICSTWSTTAADIFRAGLRDDRIQAGALLACGDFDKYGAAGVGQIAVPVQHLTGSLDDRNGGNGPLYWDAFPSPAWRANTEHGAHNGWTDFATTDAAIEGVLPAERTVRIGKIYVAAFADHTIGGEEAPLEVLDGTLVVDDDVTVYTR